MFPRLRGHLPRQWQVDPQDRQKQTQATWREERLPGDWVMVFASGVSGFGSAGMEKGLLVLAAGKLAAKEKRGRRDQIKRSADCERACTAVPLAAERTKAEAVGASQGLAWTVGASQGLAWSSAPHCCFPLVKASHETRGRKRSPPLDGRRDAGTRRGGVVANRLWRHWFALHREFHHQHGTPHRQDMPPESPLAPCTYALLSTHC